MLVSLNGGLASPSVENARSAPKIRKENLLKLHPHEVWVTTSIGRNIYQTYLNIFLDMIPRSIKFLVIDFQPNLRTIFFTFHVTWK